MTEIRRSYTGAGVDEQATHPSYSVQTAVEVHPSAADSPLYDSAEYGSFPTLPYPTFLFSVEHAPELYLCGIGHAKFVTKCG